VLVPLDAVTYHVSTATIDEPIRSTFTEYVSTLSDVHASLLTRYRVLDIAHEVIGVGSVGMRAFVVLLQNNTGDHQ
jgi:uncharacterized protein (DUF2252 family)